jgi:hypothetical protein
MILRFVFIWPRPSRPLDALAKSDDEWLGWQIYSGKKRERFVKEFLASFAQISGSRFLFFFWGGVDYQSKQRRVVRGKQKRPWAVRV